MAVYDLLQLDITLTQNSIPQAVRGQIESYLFNHGFFQGSDPLHDPPFADVENGVSPAADVEWLHGANVTVTTDTALDYILDGTPGNIITINGDGLGAHNIGVSVLGGTSLFLNDSGNDSISANGGSNTIDASGSTGDDTIRGSAAGHDTIHGGSGHDVLIAAAGGGELDSGSHAGGWNVLIDEGAGATTMFGGAGSDSFFAAGNDQVHMGTGDNQLAQAQFGNNTIWGGSGHGDTLKSTSSGFTVMHGGTGDNFLDAAPGAGSGTMDSGSLAGGHNVLDNESSSSWTLTGGAGNDSLFSGSGSDVLIGGSGNQLLFAGGGDDSLKATGSGLMTLQAGTGNDTLDASASSGTNLFIIGQGNETVLGGSGLDYFQDTSSTGAAGSSSFVINITGNGADTLNFNDRSQGEVANDSSNAGIRTITFNDGQEYKISDTINVTFIHS